MPDRGLGGTPGWRERLTRLAGALEARIGTPNGVIEMVYESHPKPWSALAPDVRAALAAAAPSPQEGGDHRTNPMCPSCQRQLRKTRDVYECDDCELAWPVSDEASPAPPSPPAGVQGGEATCWYCGEPCPPEPPNDPAHPACHKAYGQGLRDGAAGRALPLGCIDGPGCHDRDEDGPGEHDPTCPASRPAPSPAGVQVDRAALDLIETALAAHQQDEWIEEVLGAPRPPHRLILKGDCSSTGDDGYEAHDEPFVRHQARNVFAAIAPLLGTAPQQADREAADPPLTSRERDRIVREAMSDLLPDWRGDRDVRLAEAVIDKTLNTVAPLLVAPAAAQRTNWETLVTAASDAIREAHRAVHHGSCCTYWDLYGARATDAILAVLAPAPDADG